MCDLVRHHAGQFGFVVSGQYQARIDVKEAAWKSKSVDIVAVQDLDSEWNLSVRVSHQSLPEAIHIFRNDGVFNQSRGRFDFLRELFAHGDLPVERVPVAEAASTTYFAIADCIQVADTTIVVGLDLGARFRRILG